LRTFIGNATLFKYQNESVQSYSVTGYSLGAFCKRIGLPEAIHKAIGKEGLSYVLYADKPDNLPLPARETYMPMCIRNKTVLSLEETCKIGITFIAANPYRLKAELNGCLNIIGTLIVQSFTNFSI